MPETVRMVDPQPGYHAASDQAEDRLVRRGKDRGDLLPDRGELVDGKESPVVDLLSGDAPEGESMGLCFEQGVERVKAVRLTSYAVQAADRVVDRRYHNGRGLHELAQPSLGDELLPSPLDQPLRIAFGLWG